jgi:hypothetical protein
MRAALLLAIAACAHTSEAPATLNALRAEAGADKVKRRIAAGPAEVVEVQCTVRWRAR